MTSYVMPAPKFIQESIATQIKRCVQHSSTATQSVKAFMICKTRFLPQCRRYSFVAKYIARLDLYHTVYDELFNRAKRLPWSHSKTAAIMEVSKLISFCV